MNVKTASSKLAKFFARHGVRYKWDGSWPAIPVRLGVMEFDERVWRNNPPNLDVEIAGGTIIKMPPPDVTPAWVEKIYELLFEKILRLKNGMTLEFFEAAIYGYAYSSIQRARTAQLEACKRLPPESAQRQVHEELAKIYKPTLDVCRQRITEVLAGWTLNETADYLAGFAYGMKCQLREESWMPSADTETLQICKALVKNQSHIKTLVREGKTSKEIAGYISKHATLNDGKITHDLRFCQTEEGKAKYLKSFQKLCERIGLPLPSPGRPSTTSKITTPEN
jgi:hypothetical protein